MNPSSYQCERVISKEEVGGPLNRGQNIIVIPIIIEICKNRRPTIRDGIDSR
jgi:hypothetical protein